MTKITFFFLLMLASCTISFSNVSTHGTATDLIDEDMKNDADVKPNLNLEIPPGL